MKNRLYAIRLIIVVLLTTVCLCAATSESDPSPGGGSSTDGAGAGVAFVASALPAIDSFWAAPTVLDFANRVFQRNAEFCDSSKAMINWETALDTRDPGSWSLEVLRTEISNEFDTPLIPYAEVMHMYDTYFTRLQASPLCAPDNTSWYAANTSQALTTEHKNILSNVKEALPHIEAFAETLVKDYTDVLPFVQRIELPAGSKMLFLGDLHGSIHSLLRNMLHMAQQGYLSNDWKLKDGMHLMVLGDMTDYGCYGVEVLYTLLKLKLANWDRVFFVRGNHENISMATGCGFRIELLNKYKGGATAFQDGKNIFQKFILMSATLPLAIFVSSASDPDSYIQCCHGGVEPFYNPTIFLGASDKTKQYNLVTRNTKPSLIPLMPKPSLTEMSSYDVVDDYEVGKGFQWSDFTGIRRGGDTTHHAYVDKNELAAWPEGSVDEQPEDATKAWILNKSRGGRDGSGAIGFNANHADMAQYIEDRPNVIGFIRGHQDMKHCCKLIEDGLPGLLPWWDENSSAVTEDEDVVTGIKIYERVRYKHWMVVTLTSAADAKGNISEGYSMLCMDGPYANWDFYIYENLLSADFSTTRDFGRLGYAIVAKEDTQGRRAKTCRWAEDDAALGGVAPELAAVLLGQSPAIEVFGSPTPPEILRTGDAAGEESEGDEWADDNQLLARKKPRRDEEGAGASGASAATKPALPSPTAQEPALPSYEELCGDDIDVTGGVENWAQEFGGGGSGAAGDLPSDEDVSVDDSEEGDEDDEY
jgi:hypothetical protein